jgi:hypothetical protein
MYQVSVVQVNHTALRFFIAQVKADGKSALGTGRSKNMAQTVATRSFLNNRFLPGNYYSQTGTPVCNPGVAPSKKKKQREQMSKWVDKKEKLRTEEEESSGVNEEVSNVMQPGSTQKGKKFIFFDLERAGGNIESEIIQIGFTDGQNSESIFIQPKGKISKQSSKYSHKMSLSKSGKLATSTGGFIKCSSLIDAAERFISFIKLKKDECGQDPCLVFYGGDDDVCLLNNLAIVRKDQDLVECVSSFLDFQSVIKDDDQFKDVSVSLTKIQPNKKNITQHILGPKIIGELKMSHDASYDADLLKRVFQVYLKSWSYAVDLSPYMIPSKDSLLTAQIIVGKLSERRIRRGTSYDFLTFNGWK